jgi:cytochrome P450
VFADPNVVDIDRTGNRHMGYGLGVHRCIGSNVARVLFKRMLRHVLKPIPDYQSTRPGRSITERSASSRACST